MECMYAQTRPWFIFSSERVFRGMESKPMLTREKSPLPEAQRRIKPMTLYHAELSPMHYKLSYNGTPCLVQNNSMSCCPITKQLHLDSSLQNAHDMPSIFSTVKYGAYLLGTNYMLWCSTQSINRMLLHWLKQWDHVVFDKELPLVNKAKQKAKNKEIANTKWKKFQPEVSTELDDFKRPVQKVVF